jgi:hypothetical protein
MSHLGSLERSFEWEKVEISHLEETAETIVGIHDIYGFIDENIGFGNLFTRPHQRTYAAKVLREIVLARIARPASKRSTASFLATDFDKDMKLDHIYQN